jgi:hypothetical protein
MPRYLVELYLPGAARDCHEETTARARAAAAAMRRAGTDVRFVRSIFLPGDETCFHVYEADSAATVGEASRRAGIEFERVVDAVDA